MVDFSLYVHLPWCIKRCPYCDFNAHTKPNQLPEIEYINALKKDIDYNKHLVKNKKLISIFFGGGTPSLFSIKAIGIILDYIDAAFNIDAKCEITLEANPGTLDNKKLSGFNLAGINRLSIGVQSFDDECLKALGRIHNSQSAVEAIKIAKNQNYKSINCDLMFGLPKQNKEKMLNDIDTAVSLGCEHISWYELTLEPNTLFARYPPVRVNDDIRSEWFDIGKSILINKGYTHYEISAFCKPMMHSIHNTNIWKFGDYLGIGAGAHSKIGNIRYIKNKHPKMFINNPEQYMSKTTIKERDLIFEYLLNRLRLTAPITWEEAYFGAHILPNNSMIEKAKKHKFIIYDNKSFQLTAYGRKFLDDVVTLFLSE